MRPVARRQGALRAPLNSVLGTEANVRILRELAHASGTVGLTELARRTQLEPSGVRRATLALENTGIVEGLWVGNQRLACLSRRHPLAGALRELFAAELARRDAVRDGIRRAASALTPAPISVWLEGPADGEPDQPEAPLTVGVCTSAAELDATVLAYRQALASLETLQDVTIEVRGYTKVDLRTLAPEERGRLARSVTLFGPPPDVLTDQSAPRRDSPQSAKSPEIRSHADLDARALVLADAVAEKLARDPNAVERAREYLTRRLEHASPGERHELQEWQHLLETASPRRLRQFLRDSSGRAIRLRQTLPFLDVLTSEEREAAIRRAQPEADTETPSAREALPTTPGGT